MQLNFSRNALFHTNTKVCLIYFGQDCRSEKNVSNLIEFSKMNTLTLDQNELYYLSSGFQKEDGVEALVNIWHNGKIIADEFLEKRILSSEKKFHDPLTRIKVPSIQEPINTLNKEKKDEVVYANSYIVSKLLSLSAKCGKPADFQKALTYPLYSFPLGMAFPDGCKRETSKNKLLEQIIPENPEKREEIDIAKNVYT